MTPGKGRLALLLLWALAWLGFTPLPGFTAAAFATTSLVEAKSRILILHSYHPGLMWTDRLQQGLQDELLVLKPKAELLVEYLDSKRHTDSGTIERLRDLLTHKYAGTRLDAVVTSDDNAFRFALELRETLFPETPIVFSGVNSLETYKEDPRLNSLLTNTTGVVESYDVSETLRLALRLHPETETVFIINDRTTTGLANKRVLKAAIAELGEKRRFEYLEAFSMEELLERVAALDENSLILLMSFNRDRLGKTFSYRHSIDLIAAQSRVPIYGVWGFYLGRGIVGGLLTDGRTQGISAARLTAQILGGKRAEDLAVMTRSPNRFMFDDHQLKRFSIQKEKLPEKRLVINETIKLYVRYRGVILTALVALTLQSLIILGLAINIRRRRQAERRLAESKAYYEKVFENIQDAYYEVTVEGDLLEMSPSIVNVLGYTRDELIGHNIRSLYVTPGEHDPLMKTLHRQQRLPDYEVLLKDPDGKAIPCAINATMLPKQPGAPDRIVGSMRNISVRKAAEEELYRLRKYLSNIIDSMPSVLVGVDKEGRVTQWNLQAEQVTGTSVEKALAQPFAAVFPRLKGEADLIQNAIKEGRVFKDLKVPNHNHGETCYEDVTIFPLVANGVEGVVIRVDDVTERVRMEEAMIQNEKMLSVGGLAAGMAHEINNPLSGILQNSAVLSNRLLKDLPANLRAAETAGISMAAIQHYLELRNLPEMIENIRSSGLRAAKIVKNMLGFTRKSDRTVANCDLCILLDKSLELIETDYDMKKKYDFKSIRIIRDYDDSDTKVPCEAGKLQQVFLNVLKNGAEAMAEAQETMKSASFYLRVKSDGTWAQVEIEDNGPGMDEKTRRSVFDPFFTTKPTGQGTGLGLSVSYYIITEDHGGEMEVHTSIGKGTRFVIRLPLEIETATAGARPGAS